MTKRAPCFIDILENLLDLPDAKSLFPEHVAESAFIMGTAQGCLYQQAVGFHPRPVYFSFVIHIYFLFIELFYYFGQNRLDNTNNCFTFLCVQCIGMGRGKLTDVIVKILAGSNCEFI